MEQLGLPIGLGLLGLVVACGLALGWKAARGVERFREDRHESFIGKEPRR